MHESNAPPNVACRVVVIWIDWYAYHLARFEGLQSVFGSKGEVVGVEMVGGVGVHAGLNFRGERALDAKVDTLLPESSWSQSGKFTLALLLWKKLNNLTPETVLVPGYYTVPALAAALWAKVHGKQCVLMTESTAGDHKRTSWKEALKGVAIRWLFDWAVTGGKAHVRYLGALGFPSNRVVGFYDVVGNEAVQKATANLLARENAASFSLPENYFLYVGRLAPEKNVAGLIRSWLMYRHQGGTWRLVLVGDGPDSQRLQELSGSSGYAEDILFAGHHSSQGLVPYFSFASCFVLPSLREPWGLVVNEAMAAGLPVIVSSRCGCAEDLVVEGQNGFIFDPTMEEELSACLSNVEQLPNSRLREMGSRSAEIIAPFCPENFGREIANIADSAHPWIAHSPLHRSSEPVA